MELEDKPTVGAALLGAGARWPDQEAFVCDGIRLTYRDLADGARRTAAALIARGVRKGDAIAICVGNSAIWPTLFYAGALIGAVAVPIATASASAERVDRLRRSKSVLLVTEVDPLPDGVAPPHLHTVVALGRAVPPGAIGYGAFQGQVGTGRAPIDRTAVERAAAAVGPDDAALLDDPAGALLSHAGLLRAGADTATRIGARLGDRYFTPRPFDVVAAALPILVALSAGACLLTAPTLDAAEADRIMARERGAPLPG